MKFQYWTDTGMLLNKAHLVYSTNAYMIFDIDKINSLEYYIFFALFIV